MRPDADQPPPKQSHQSFLDHQERRRQELWGLLGDLPPRKRPSGELLRRRKGPGYTRESLHLELNGLGPVPAYLLLPDRRPEPARGLLYVHAHGSAYALGKDELLRGSRFLRPYAPALAEKGIVTLAIDSWCFGGRKEYQDGRQGEWDTFKLMLWQGRVLWGMMLFDELQALDYLAARPEVDPQRLGVFGLSMGATKAWWLAALDTRVRLCIDLCCLTDYHALIEARNLRGHGIYYYVPGLLKHFQTHQINALNVPRPRLSLNGRHDPLTPPAGVERVRDHVLPLYARHGRREDCRIELYDCGHEETPTMRALVLEWLGRHLLGAGG
jgi:dienelactone hydrolase